MSSAADSTADDRTLSVLKPEGSFASKLEARKRGELISAVKQQLGTVDAYRREDVREALRTLGMHVVLPELLDDLDEMKPGEKLRLFSELMKVGMQADTKQAEESEANVRVVYMLPD